MLSVHFEHATCELFFPDFVIGHPVNNTHHPYTCCLNIRLLLELHVLKNKQGLITGHTKDVIKMVPVVPLFGTQHKIRKYWLFLKN